MAAEPAKLEDLVETTAKATEAVRDKIENVEKSLKQVNAQFENLDGVDKDTVMKASEEAAEAVQGVRDLQAAVKADEWTKSLKEQGERIKDLELEVAKGGGSKDGKVLNFSDYHKALSKNIRQPRRTWNFNDEVLHDEAMKMVGLYAPHLDNESKEKVSKTLIAGFDTEGGVWVPTERVAQMIRQIFETSPIRQAASVMSTGTNMVEMIIDDGELSAVWGGELHTITNTPTPKLGTLKIDVHELYARPLITLNMLEDASIDVVSWLTNKATDKFGRTENTAFVVGDGSQKPKGLLSYDDYSAGEKTAGYGRGKVERINSGESATLGPAATRGDSLFRIQNALKEPYQAGAIWMTKRVNFLQFQIIRDSDGQYLFKHGDALATGIGPTVLGKPLFFADDFPEFAADSLSVVYGNLNMGYTIVDRMGITVLVDPYSQDPQITGFLSPTSTSCASWMCRCSSVAAARMKAATRASAIPRGTPAEMQGCQHHERLACA